MSITVDRALKEDFDKKTVHQQTKMGARNQPKKECEKVMDKLNYANYPWYIQSDDKILNKPLNCIDAIRLNMKLDELVEDPKKDKRVFCGL